MMAGQNMRQFIHQVAAGYYEDNMSNGYSQSVMRDNMSNQAGMYCTPRDPQADEMSRQMLRDEVERHRAKVGMPPAPIHTPAADNGQRVRRSDKVSDPVNQPGIDATLDERGKRYGSYAEKAEIIQKMKESMRGGSSWAAMGADMKETLEMVVHKIGRIVTGDVTYQDNWHDIIGYTKLVEDRLKGVQR